MFSCSQKNLTCLSITINSIFLMSGLPKTPCNTMNESSYITSSFDYKESSCPLFLPWLILPNKILQITQVCDSVSVFHTRLHPGHELLNY